MGDIVPRTPDFSNRKSRSHQKHVFQSFWCPGYCCSPMGSWPWWLTACCHRCQWCQSILHVLVLCVFWVPLQNHLPVQLFSVGFQVWFVHATVDKLLLRKYKLWHKRPVNYTFPGISCITWSAIKSGSKAVKVWNSYFHKTVGQQLTNETKMM